MKHEEAEERIITLSEVSKILHVCPNTLRDWDKRGVLILVYFSIKHIRRYRKSDIDNLIAYKS